MHITSEVCCYRCRCAGSRSNIVWKKLATISYCCSFLCAVIKTSGILPEFCFSLHLLVAMCHRKIDASVISVNRKKMRKKQIVICAGEQNKN